MVLDACTRRVVGWSIDASQIAALVTNTPDMAIRNRAASPGVVIDSDDGQNTSSVFANRARAPGPAALDGARLVMLRQRDDRVVLGPSPDRTAETAKVGEEFFDAPAKGSG